MRPCTLALLLCLLLPVPGCYVIDEIDAGREMMEAHSPSKNKNKKKQEEAAAEGEKPPTYQETQESWWKDAKSLSLSPDDAAASDDPTVACKHAGKTLFTKRSDCIARGGEPG